MAASKTAGPRKGAGRSSSTPKLPPVTVARLEETGKLLERVVASNQQLFIAKGQEYRDAHRAGSSRPLSALEAAQIATALGTDTPVQTAQEVQESTLRAYDEPAQREILVSAGIAVGPAFLAAVREVVALVEMPADLFERACEEDTLTETIDTAAAALRPLEASVAKQRASAAFAHYAAALGFQPGEAMRLPVQAVWQALQGAMTHLTAGSESSQLIDSAASTEDSPEATSSTSSGGPTP